MRPQSQLLSIALHAALILLALVWPFGGPASAPESLRPLPSATRLIWRPYTPAKPSGGGRPSAPLASTKGALPQVLRPVFIPPTPQHVERPHLILDSGVDTAVPRIDLPSIGDPLASLGGPPSSGAGAGPGIGAQGRGPYGHGGDGDGQGAIPAPVLGATPPVLVHKVEPDYSDEARKSHFQGTVLLAVDIDERGQVINVRVLRPLGLGLDEKAVDAVRRWRFTPARKNGRAIAYPAAIEVRFQLL